VSLREAGVACVLVVLLPALHEPHVARRGRRDDEDLHAPQHRVEDRRRPLGSGLGLGFGLGLGLLSLALALALVLTLAQTLTRSMW
jgi:hypothetical protein